MTPQVVIQIAEALGMAPETLTTVLWSSVFLCAGIGILCVAWVGLQFFPAGDEA